MAGRIEILPYFYEDATGCYGKISRAGYFASNFAKYLSGSFMRSSLQLGQQRKTSRPLTVTLNGVPISPSFSPETGQTFCASAAVWSAADSFSKPSGIFAAVASALGVASLAAG